MAQKFIGKQPFTRAKRMPDPTYPVSTYADEDSHLAASEILNAGVEWYPKDWTFNPCLAKYHGQEIRAMLVTMPDPDRPGMWVRGWLVP